MDSTKIFASKVLDEICRYLRAVFAGRAAQLSRTVDDRRSESLQNEAEVRQMLRTFAITPGGFFSQHELTLVEPRTTSKGISETAKGERDPNGWFDFAIESPQLFVPVNIKVSDIAGRNADNLNCKLGLYWALTGQRPDFANSISFERMMQRMVGIMSDHTEADYYFLVINKADPKDLFWNSLKRLESLGPNGRNPPFQGRWALNRNGIPRTNEEARRFLLSKLRESFVQAAKPLVAFDQLMKPFIEEAEETLVE